MIQLTTIAGLFACVASLAGCETNPSTGRSQLILISPEDAAKMGKQAKPELIKEYGGEVRSTELRSYVSQTGNRLARHVEPDFKDIQWEFITLNSDVLNAFALPGGKVFISRELLLQFDNEAQLAGVLGHEIGHITGRHVDERISQAIAIDLGLQLGGGLTDSEIAAAAGQLFGQGYLLKFSRDQEREADRQGVKYMVRSGYDPQAMVDVMQIFVDASRSGGAPPEILSTHPDPQRRLSELEALIELQYAYTRNNPDYRKFEGRFQNQAEPYLRDSVRGNLASPVEWCAVCRHQNRLRLTAGPVDMTPLQRIPAICGPVVGTWPTSR